jgi:hypothetical protein
MITNKDLLYEKYKSKWLQQILVISREHFQTSITLSDETKKSNLTENEIRLFFLFSRNKYQKCVKWFIAIRKSKSKQKSQFLFMSLLLKLIDLSYIRSVLVAELLFLLVFFLLC